jgi:hypothetical protein
MPESEYRVALYSLEQGEARDLALVDLGKALPGADIGEPDDVGIVEVSLEADSFDDALTKVWDAVAAAGVDDQLAFAEHPDLPEHWRDRAVRPQGN